MGLFARFRQWQTDRRELRIERLTAKAADLREDAQHDLVMLHERGFVRARANGQSIVNVNADVESLIRKPLRVIVNPGTYFVASGGHQNMVTTQKYSFSLSSCGQHRMDVRAACINANRPIPGKNDRFRGVARVPDAVARFLEASAGEDPMVVQAGVWTLTDGYSRDQVIRHLISRDHNGNTWHPVTQAHCDKAKAILNSLGIAHRL
jgi:hypothetical protein